MFKGESVIARFWGSRSLDEIVGVGIAISLAIFHIWTSAFGVLTPMLQRLVHLSGVLILAFLIKRGKGFWRYLDWVCVFLVLLSFCYVWSNFDELVYRMGEPNTFDLIFGAVLIVVLLEAARRVLGISLPLLALLALIYARWGNILPGILSHRGYSWSRIISQIYLTTEGIFGLPLGVSATYVAIFIIFGSLLAETGGGKFFIDLAFALTGRSRGGPARTAVVSSALMGTISGSPVANVVTTGTFTIPLMKKLGYPSYVAGAIEAVASSGGALMPPIMGAGAFIMSEITGIPYGKIIVAALIPALLYYITLFIIVGLEAGKGKLSKIERERTSILSIIKEGYHLFLPIIVLVYLLVVKGYTPVKAALWSLVILIVISMVQRKNRLSFYKLIRALEDAGKGLVMVGSACATAGIVIGVITQTGVGLKFTSFLVDLSGEYKMVALIFVMVAGIIIGMGLPPAAAYVILAVMGGPALVKLGFSKLASHLFIYYWSCMAPITPPVALAAYAAAGIAESDPVKTGWTACKFGLVGFIIPYVFIFEPSLLFEGSFMDVFLSFITASIGVFALSLFSVGWLSFPLSWWKRAGCLFSSICLIYPGYYTDLVGFGLLIVVLLHHLRLRGKFS